MRKTIIRVHYNKHTGFWTIKHKGRCIPAKNVEFRSGCQTLLRENGRNPRAFMEAHGYLVQTSPGKFIVSGNGEYLDPNYKVL